MPRTTRHPHPTTGLILASLWALALGSCRSPKPAAATTPAATPAAGAPAHPAGPPKPQFTFATWGQATGMIKAGQVIQTVSSSHGFSLILQDHTWVHVLAKPGEPLPKNPRSYVFRNAPNAAAIRHTNE
jgi:hypothetical protein